MNGSLLLAVAVAAVGGDFGWQPYPGGGLEYIVQIEPHFVDRLREGTDIISDVPANVKNIRSCRFTVGSGELPRIDDPRIGTEPENYLPPSAPPKLPEPPEARLVARPDGTPKELPYRDGTEGGVISAVMLQGTEPPPISPETSAPTIDPDRAEPVSSWLLATLAIGLMGTTAGMLFTGWTAWDYRVRYRRVLEKLTLEERLELGMAADGGGG